MEEVPFAGEHHREPELVGLLDHRFVAHRAAGLDDRGDAARPRPLRRRLRTGRTRRSRTRRRCARPAAFFAAISPDSTRFCWPAPMPTAWRSFTSTIAFDFTCPQMRHASSRSRHCSGVGATLVTTRQSLRVAAKWCGACTRKPPEIWRTSSVSAPGAGASRMRVFLRLLLQRLDRAGVVARRDHDVGLRAGDHPLDGRRVDRPVERDDAAERGPLVAFERTLVGGRRGRRRRATPHGFACLMIAQAGRSPRSCTSCHAASAS